MEKQKLTKREYLGIGNWYVNENKESVPYNTIEELPANCTSFGGNSLLDTENGLGSLGDYFIKDGKYYVYEITPMFGNVNEVEYSEEDFNNKYV